MQISKFEELDEKALRKIIDDKEQIYSDRNLANSRLCHLRILPFLKKAKAEHKKELMGKLEFTPKDLIKKHKSEEKGTKAYQNYYYMEVTKPLRAYARGLRDGNGQEAT